MSVDTLSLALSSENLSCIRTGGPFNLQRAGSTGSLSVGQLQGVLPGTLELLPLTGLTLQQILCTLWFPFPFEHNKVLVP